MEQLQILILPFICLLLTAVELFRPQSPASLAQNLRRRESWREQDGRCGFHVDIKTKRLWFHYPRRIYDSQAHLIRKKSIYDHFKPIRSFAPAQACRKFERFRKVIYKPQFDSLEVVSNSKLQHALPTWELGPQVKLRLSCHLNPRTCPQVICSG